MTIQPTAVYAPGQSPASQNFYQTYNTRTLGGGGGGYTPPPPSGGGFNYGGSYLYRQFQRVPGGGAPVPVPNGVPKFLGGRGLLLFSWVAAMMMVSLDEWHTHHVLPRPARLWYTSLTYFLLAILSTFDMAVPLANLLAIGLTVSVAYEYYNGSGDFGNFGAQEGAGQTPAQSTAPSGSGGGGGAKTA